MPERTVVGVDLGGTKVTAGAVAGGAVERVESRRISAHEGEAVVLAEVFGAIEAVFDARVAAIGCGVPSVVDLGSGVVLEVANIPSWRRVPLKALLEERFGVPARVNNDANAFALGEHVFGRGRAFRNLVGLTLGTGLGAGIIIDGRLHCGRTCGAGEIGMIPYRGETVEAFCSGQFFPRDCGADGESVYRRARAGDAGALAAFARFGRELAAAVMITVYTYDPEAILLGGSIASAFDLFAPALSSELESASYQALTRGLVIEPSRLPHAAVLGAAALALEALPPGASGEGRR